MGHAYDPWIKPWSIGRACNLTCKFPIFAFPSKFHSIYLWGLTIEEEVYDKINLHFGRDIEKVIRKDIEKLINHEDQLNERNFGFNIPDPHNLVMKPLVINFHALR